MRDTTKLPKWAQEMICELQSSQTLTGANISDVRIENVGFKHDENSAKAIEAIANALSENAKALSELSKSVMPKNVTMNSGPALSISDVRAK